MLAYGQNCLLPAVQGEKKNIQWGIDVYCNYEQDNLKGIFFAEPNDTRQLWFTGFMPIPHISTADFIKKALRFQTFSSLYQWHL